MYPGSALAPAHLAESDGPRPVPVGLASAKPEFSIFAHHAWAKLFQETAGSRKHKLKHTLLYSVIRANREIDSKLYRHATCKYIVTWRTNEYYVYASDSYSTR